MGGRDRPNPRPAPDPVRARDDARRQDFYDPDGLFDPDGALEQVRRRDEAVESTDPRGPADPPAPEPEPPAGEGSSPWGPAPSDPVVTPDGEIPLDEVSGVEGLDDEVLLTPLPVDEAEDEDPVGAARPDPSKTPPEPAHGSSTDPSDAGSVGPGSAPTVLSGKGKWEDRSDSGSGVGELAETERDPRIPAGKTRFRIGEVATIVGVRPYVIRYWENEFAWLQPDKTETGQRRYGRADVALLLRIKRLRHDQQLTVAQTRALLEGGPAATAPLADGDRGRIKRQLNELRREVLDLLAWAEE
jgi:DNA-binding transcriptional MerR regulator